jgi:hypothetical protein
LRSDIDLDAALKLGGFEFRAARSPGEVRRVCMKLFADLTAREPPPKLWLSERR